MIQQNAGVSEEMAATAEELARHAELLQSSIAFFMLEDSDDSGSPYEQDIERTVAVSDK